MAVEIKVGQVSGSRQGDYKSGVLLTFVAVLFWSTTGPLIELLVRDHHLSPTELSLWRTVIIIALLALIVVRLEGWKGFKLSRAEIPFYFLNGLMGVAIFNVAWSNSVQINGTAVATTLLYSAPVFVALGSWLFLREKVGLPQLAAIAVNILGCMLVTGAYNPEVLLRNPAGILLGLGSGFTFASYTLLSKVVNRHHPRGWSSSLFHLMLFGLLPLLPWGLFQEGPKVLNPVLNIWGWLLLVVLAYGPTLGGYVFYNAGLKYLPAAVASLFTTLELPLAALQALILFGRGMTLLQWSGALLIIGAVVTLQFRDVRASLKKNL